MSLPLLGKKRGNRGARALFHSALMLLSLAIWPINAEADKIPGTSLAGPQYYFTTEMTSVELEFWPNAKKKTNIPPITKFSIPRAYIFYVSRESRNSRKPLSSSMEAKWVNIMLTYPDGLPYSHAIRDYGKQYRVSSGVAARALRKQLLTVQISGSVGDAHSLSFLSPRQDNYHIKYETSLGTYLGLKRFKTGSSAEMYYGPTDAIIRKIQCRRTPEKAHPRFFCTYWTVLNKHLVAAVKFVDFRVHGGLDFANERVRLFRETICRYVACDDRRKPDHKGR